MNYIDVQVFVCFAAEDRYAIVEPIVYHLNNYGIHTWYDRRALVMGDNRIEKNLIEGATKCRYALTIISKHTENSKCAMEELSIIEQRYRNNNVTVFPVLYEIAPDDLPQKLLWIKEVIFKEADRQSGSRQVCNHVACRITNDIITETKCNCKTIQDIVNLSQISPELTTVQFLLKCYLKVDHANLNSRITLLYAVYVFMINEGSMPNNSTTRMITQLFDRMFSETSLNLMVDYRELWLLENSICILFDHYTAFCTESNM